MTGIIKYKLDIFFVLLIVFATIYTWGGVLSQTIEGEGYYYFSPTNSLFPNGHLVNFLHTFDNFPRATSYILQRIAGGNIQPYMTFQFIGIILVNVSVYLFLRKITGKPLLAFLAAIYSGVNYTANFQFYARGHYQWYTQRVLEFIPVLGAVYFIYLFLIKKKYRNYFFALALFTLAVLMTHYTTLLLAFPVFFVFAYSILKKKTLKDKLLFCTFALPFILINYAIVHGTSLSPEVIRPHQTFWQFLETINDILTKISYQLVVVTIPFPVLRFFSNIYHLPYKDLITRLVIPVYLFYAVVFLVFLKNKVESFYLPVAAFLSLFAFMFLTVYVNRVNVFNEVEQGRYYYYPAIYVGMILAYFLYIIFERSKNISVIVKYGFILSLSLVWVIVNSSFIHAKMKSTQIYYTQNRIMFAFLTDKKEKLPNNAFVLLPNPPGPNSVDFLKNNFGKSDTTFLYLDQNWKDKIPTEIKAEKLFVYDYSKSDNEKVIDRSEEFRNQLNTINYQKKI